LVSSPIETTALLREVADGGFGAATLFLGTVRDTNDGKPVTGIEYAAYEAMARSELARIAEEAADRFGIGAVVVEHRLGYLSVGEASIAIVCADAHRSPTMDGTRYIIEQVKRRVPIWKREHYRDGTREWVDPTRTEAPAASVP
jgi:molybdopterin synthase catalytic subunit